ncbi:MAG TPA: SBBP repeat-containing protein [Pyrinomonadaceae bacterium]|nr:SBBP repeat-containing protein [Pyrinomonadaceae bacterium]
MVIRPHYSQEQNELSLSRSPLAQIEEERKNHAAKASFTVNGFIENKGQFVDAQRKPLPKILFKATLDGVDVYITTDGITYVFTKIAMEQARKQLRPGVESAGGERGRVEWRRLDLRLFGATIRRENVLAERPVAQGYFNYYLSHRPQGITNVKAFHQVTIRNVYPGIDWRLSDDGARGLKQEFVVHPGAKPSAIRMRYTGAGKIAALNGGKSLRLKTTLGEIEEGPLLSHQGNPSQPVNSLYKVLGTEARFAVGTYDTGRELVIDPPLHIVWATLYGGIGPDGPTSLVFDASNNLYVVGYTGSTNFPTKSMGSAYFQAMSSSTNYNVDAFILKFDHAGVRQWATRYSSNADDVGTGVVTDAAGNVYVTGWTSVSGSSFPTMAPASSTIPVQTNSGGSVDAFLLKFNPGGVRQWATLYGGSGQDEAKGITADPFGNVYIAGMTSSTNLPVNPPPGGSTTWQANNAGGTDAFVGKYNPSGAREWATYYGGSGSDYATAITRHGFQPPLFGGVYITGNTNSTNLPLTVWPGGYNQLAPGGNDDAFLLAMTPAGVRSWATYYGGKGFESATAITSHSHAFFVTGSSVPVSTTPANSFPTYLSNLSGVYYQPTYINPPPYPATPAFADYDAFILMFDYSNRRNWATLFGGTGNDSGRAITTDKLNNTHVAGATLSADLPILNPAGNVFFDATFNGAQDVFIASFGPAGQQQWTTYAGGDGGDFPTSMVSSSLNCLFLTGEFVSTPSTLPLLNPGGGAYFQNTMSSHEGFLMKLCY